MTKAYCSAQDYPTDESLVADQITRYWSYGGNLRFTTAAARETQDNNNMNISKKPASY